jgi:hypothetical protein
MYLDTKGNVTVGVGFMIPTPLAACGYPFYLLGGTTLATAQEITTAWNRVKAMPPGMQAEKYAYPGCLILLQNDIYAHLLAELTTLDEALAKGITNYANLPDSVKMALLDQGWNLGLNGLLHGYPKEIACVEAGDFAGAAVQCHRNGIQESRNEWCALQFTSAITA